MPSFAWRTSVNKPFTLRVFDRYGAGALLATAGVMARANSAVARTVPRPVKRQRFQMANKSH